MFYIICLACMALLRGMSGMTMVSFMSFVKMMMVVALVVKTIVDSVSGGGGRRHYGEACNKEAQWNGQAESDESSHGGCSIVASSQARSLGRPECKDVPSPLHTYVYWRLVGTPAA